jgi:hypothetical protein
MVRKVRVKAVAGYKIAHPSAGAIKPDGSLWPFDQFTMRRIREGSVALEKDEPKKPEPKTKPSTAPQT